ncbi:MAG: formyltransferase family protein [Pseudomonadales bacterium]
MKVLFMGRKPVAAEALEFLLQKEQINVVGVLTDSHLSISPTSDVASHYGIPLYEFSEALSLMKQGALEFDFGISMLYWRKLKEEFLTLPKLGIINFHPAPLPDFKGTAGYNMAILKGLDKWAVTAHYIDEEIDSGGIVEVSSFSIDPDNETAKSLEKTSQPMLLNLFKRVINTVTEQKALLPVTPNSGGCYISRSEMEALKEVKDGDDVSRKIRAFWFPPYDGAYAIVNGIKCTLIDHNILQQLADPDSSNLFTQPTNIKC